MALGRQPTLEDPIHQPTLEDPLAGVLGGFGARRLMPVPLPAASPSRVPRAADPLSFAGRRETGKARDPKGSNSDNYVVMGMHPPPAKAELAGPHRERASANEATIVSILVRFQEQLQSHKAREAETSEFLTRGLRDL